MSLVVERFLICDGDGERVGIDGYQDPKKDYCYETHGIDNRSFSTQQHREGAKREGWYTNGQYDYCPVCWELWKQRRIK